MEGFCYEFRAVFLRPNVLGLHIVSRPSCDVTSRSVYNSVGSLWKLEPPRYFRCNKRTLNWPKQTTCPMGPVLCRPSRTLTGRVGTQHVSTANHSSVSRSSRSVVHLSIKHKTLKPCTKSKRNAGSQNLCMGSYLILPLRTGSRLCVCEAILGDSVFFGLLVLGV